MARRRKGKKLDGWIIVDKPLGMTSSSVVGRVRALTGAAKAGHAGTLDPLASGILPVGLGEATKTMPYIVDATKDYRFSAVWGEERSTDDAEGEVIATSPDRPTDSQIDAALSTFIGAIEQAPPAYSAIKLDGKRAYDLARAGEKVEIKARPVTIHRLVRLDMPDQRDRTFFEMTCSKGTYVRSLVRDLARSLGCMAYVGDLRRTRVGPFDEKRAISLEMLDDLRHGARAEEFMHPIMTALADIPALAVTEPEAKRLRLGQALHFPTAKDGTVRVVCGDAPVAMATIDNGSVKPLRVFNL